MELGDLLSLVFVAIVVLSVLSNIFSRTDDEPADAPRPTDLNESGRTGQQPRQRPPRPVVTSERGAGGQGRMPQTVVTSEADGAGRGRMPQTVATSEADGAGRGRMRQTVVTSEADGAGRGRMRQTVATSEADGAGRGQMRQRVEDPVSSSSRDTVSMEELYPEERRQMDLAPREVHRRVDDVPMGGEMGARPRRRPAAARALGAASTTTLLRRSLQDRTTVRRAFVVKELLDTPVGLRDEA